MRIRSSLYLLIPLVVALIAITACQSGPVQNVLSWRLRTLTGAMPPPTPTGDPGAITGLVLLDGLPVSGVTVVAAQEDGTPHSATTDADGHFTLTGVPPGATVPVAVARGLEEMTFDAGFGLPWVAHVAPGATVEAPALHMRRHVPRPLPAPLRDHVGLTLEATSIVTTTWPPGSAALKREWRFTRDGAEVDTMRLFTPLIANGDSAALPLLLIIYPSDVEGWQNVSVAFAAQGAAVVAISPIAARALDIDGHAQDARVALRLALEGSLDPRLERESGVVLGGSFSSAIVHRLLRDEAGRIRATVSIGGVADAFQGAADFYAGRLAIPPQHELAVPALGIPNLLPLAFLRLSPLYNAASLPPTLIIHTAADEVIPITQAIAMEDALRTAGIAVEAYYYEDTSHYIQIGPEITEAGKSMFWRIHDFLERYSTRSARDLRRTIDD